MHESLNTNSLYYSQNAAGSCVPDAIEPLLYYSIVHFI